MQFLKSTVNAQLLCPYFFAKCLKRRQNSRSPAICRRKKFAVLGSRLARRMQVKPALSRDWDVCEESDVRNLLQLLVDYNCYSFTSIMQ